MLLSPDLQVRKGIQEIIKAAICYAGRRDKDFGSEKSGIKRVAASHTLYPAQSFIAIRPTVAKILQLEVAQPVL